MMSRYVIVFPIISSLIDAIEAFAVFDMSSCESCYCHAGMSSTDVQNIPKQVHKKLTSPEQETEDLYCFNVVCAPLIMAHSGNHN